MLAERLIVKDVEGVGQDLLDQPGRLNTFLGISLGKERFFSKRHIGMYLDWVLEHCSDFLLLIDDYEERHNYTVFKELAEYTATTLAIQRGQELARAFGKIISRYNPDARNRIHLVRAAELFQDPKCLELVTQLLAVYQEDPQFGRDVDTQVYTNIGSKLTEWKRIISGEVYNQRFPKVAKYLLEEIGVTVFIRETLGYPVEIYPGPPMRVVSNLYQGSYPDLSKRLGLAANYGYIHLDVEPIEMPGKSS